MAITNKEEGVWSIDQVYAKQNQGSIWTYSGAAGEPEQLWSWGYNTSGQLGQNSKVRYSSPVQVPGTYSIWPSASSGVDSTFTSRDGTDLWVWGSNGGGKLGQNSQVQYSSPIQVPGTWAKVYHGGGHTLATTPGGELWSWGRNENGELGQNSRTYYSSPIQISGTTWTGNIAASGGCSAAIKTDGTLWTWGRNDRGGLGLNDEIKRSSPTQIPGTWANAKLSTGGGSATFAALKSDGTLWMWGNSSRGQTGNNETAAQYRSSPTQVGSETTWASVYAGANALIATKTNGTLWAWGTRNEGVLGQNENPGSWTDGYSSPVQIPGTTWSTTQNHVQIGRMAGALKTDGTLWLWGGNAAGELGQNDRTYRSSPTQVPGTNWTDFGIDGWVGHVVATKSG